MAYFFKDTNMYQVNFRIRFDFKQLMSFIFKYVQYHHLAWINDKIYIDGIIRSLFDMLIYGLLVFLLDLFGAFFLFNDLAIEIGCR